MKKILLIAAMTVTLAGFCKDAETVLAADVNDANAQFEMGKRFANGDGVETNVVKAVQCYRRAAELGLADAQYVLGLCYDVGNCVENDAAEAAKWHRKAAEQGHAKAQGFLCDMYLQGKGVEKNVAEAVKWMRKAADQGEESEQILLGTVYLSAYGLRAMKNDPEIVKELPNGRDTGLVEMVFGKVDLSDSVWLEVKDNVELYRFFKVEVSTK